jgi:hypothetical protein
LHPPLDPSRPGIGPELVAGADALVPLAATESAWPFTVGDLLATPANKARSASVDDDQGRAAAGAQLLGFGGSVDAMIGHAAVPPRGMQTGQVQERAWRSTRCWLGAVTDGNPQVGQLVIQMPPSRWRAGSGAGPGSRPGRCSPGLTGMGDWLCIRVPAPGCSPHRRGADVLVDAGPATPSRVCIRPDASSIRASRSPHPVWLSRSASGLGSSPAKGGRYLRIGDDGVGSSSEAAGLVCGRRGA